MEQKSKNNGKDLIKSVQKSLKILKYIIEVNEEVTLSDIQKALDYNVSTIHHLLKTLIEEGFVSQNKTTKKYYIGPEIFYTWLRGRRPDNYFSRVTPILKECVDITGETTNLFIRDNGEALCITGYESPKTLRAFLKIGRRIPLPCTAAGKAFLINHTTEELKPFIKDTTKDLKSLEEELRISKQRGYTLEINEYEEMITAIGAPVFDNNGRVICTISTIAPSTRVDDERIEFISNNLINASKKISELIMGVYY